MTRFLEKSFSVAVGGDQTYRDNWDRIFKKPDMCAEHGLPLEVGAQCPYDQEINEECVVCDCCELCQQRCSDDI